MGSTQSTWEISLRSPILKMNSKISLILLGLLVTLAVLAAAENSEENSLSEEIARSASSCSAFWSLSQCSLLLRTVKRTAFQRKSPPQDSSGLLMRMLERERKRAPRSIRSQRRLLRSLRRRQESERTRAERRIRGKIRVKRKIRGKTRPLRRTRGKIRNQGKWRRKKRSQRKVGATRRTRIRRKDRLADL